MFVSVLRFAETARQLRGFHTPNVEKRGRQVELSCLGVLELRTGLGGPDQDTASQDCWIGVSCAGGEAGALRANSSPPTMGSLRPQCLFHLLSSSCR